MSQLTNDFIDKLKQEIQRWYEQNLISLKQAQRILSLYGESGGFLHKSAQPQKLITIFSILGSLLVGTGVILFFAANWQAIPKLVKLALILITTVTTYALGYYFSESKQNFPLVGRSLILLGAIFYGH